MLASAGTVLLLSAAAGLALGLRTAALNDLFDAPGETALLCAELILFHAALLGPVGLAVTIAMVIGARSRREAPRPAAFALHTLAAAIAVLLALNAVLRFPITYAPFRDVPHRLVTPRALWNLAVFASALPAFSCAALLLRPDRRRSRALHRRAAWAVPAAWLALFLLTCAWNAAYETPRPPRLVAAAAAPPAVRETAPSSPERVLLVGFDGLTWNVLNRLIPDGELPALASLASRGARGNLRTDVPTYSPILWTTIATGLPEDRHGIHANVRFFLPGMSRGITRGPRLNTMNWWNGLNRCMALAAGRGWIREEPVAGTDRRVPALWEIADRHGVSAGVSGWYATWPVAPMRHGSFFVSDVSGRDGSAWPRELVAPILARLEPAAAPADAAAALERHAVLRTRLAEHRLVASLTRELLEVAPPRLGLYYTHLVDGVQHLAWRGTDAGAFRIAGRDAAATLSEEVVAAYRVVDATLADLLAAVDETTLVVVVSDHGYSFDGNEHHFAPAGVLVAAGPGIRRGLVVEDCSIYDVAPTVLAALGVPASDEMPGRVLSEIFRPGAIAPPGRVAAYDWFVRREVEAVRSPEAERDRLDYLRSLGYVQ